MGVEVLLIRWWKGERWCCRGGRFLDLWILVENSTMWGNLVDSFNGLLAWVVAMVLAVSNMLYLLKGYC
jgi:hypothetical protein